MTIIIVLSIINYDLLVIGVHCNISDLFWESELVFVDDRCWHISRNLLESTEHIHLQNVGLVAEWKHFDFIILFTSHDNQDLTIDVIKNNIKAQVGGGSNQAFHE